MQSLYTKINLQLINRTNEQFVCKIHWIIFLIIKAVDSAHNTTLYVWVDYIMQPLKIIYQKLSKMLINILIELILKLPKSIEECHHKSRLLLLSSVKQSTHSIIKIINALNSFCRLVGLLLRQLLEGLGAKIIFQVLNNFIKHRDLSTLLCIVLYIALYSFQQGAVTALSKLIVLLKSLCTEALMI